MTPIDQKLMRIVDSAYAAADPGGSWTPVLESISAELAAPVVGITTMNGLEAIVGLDHGELHRYGSYYARINPWFRNGWQPPLGEVFLASEVLAPSVYQASEFFQDWGKANHVMHAVGGAVRCASPEGNLLFLSINRGHDQSNFDETSVLWSEPLCRICGGPPISAPE